MEAEVDGIYSMLTERFGADPFGFTFFLGTDKGWFRQLALPLGGGRWVGSGEGSCSFRNGPEFVLMFTVRCYDAFSEIVHRHLLDAAVDQTAPFWSLPEVEADHDRRGPMWLRRGGESYTRHVYLAATGGGAPWEARDGFTLTAVAAPQPLSAMESRSAANGAWNQVVALGFLAVEWLAERAGEPALLDYHRSLPSSTSWHAAFESAFGLTTESFYEQFEAYRATLR